MMNGGKHRHLLRHPCLAGKFFARPHRVWGAAVCWYEWNYAQKHWCVNWGIGCKTIRDAKQLRRFLNSRVAVFPLDFGTPFDDVVRFVRCNPQSHQLQPLKRQRKNDG